MLKGYSINKKLLQTEQQKVETLQQEINQLNEELFQTQKALNEGLLSIISNYPKSFELLNKYDKDELSSENLNNTNCNFKLVQYFKIIQWLMPIEQYV